MSLLDSFPFDHGSPVFSFMWHWCLTLFWNISASWNNLCLVVPRKVEFVILYLSFLCLILGKRDVCRLLWTRCLEPSPSLEWFSFSPTTTLTTHFFLHLFCQIVFFSGLSTSLYQVSSCHWLRTPDRNHLQKKGSFIRTDNFIGFSPWSGGTSWRRLRLNKVAHFLLAGKQRASKQLEKRCLSKACLQWTAFFSQSQFLTRPLGCSIIKDPLMRSEFLWFSHIPRAPKLATKTSANWIWETFQI